VALGGLALTRRAEQLGRALVVDHFDFIWRLLRRLGLSSTDADDAAQHVFMTATQKVERIAPGSERTYLYGVALRVAQNHKRKLQRRPAQAELGELELMGAAAPPDQALELAQALKLLDGLLLTLPEELSRVLVLAEIEQLEVAEIATLEGLPVGTAASRLRRARSAFREALAASETGHPFQVASK
jgi:RNA polymerase sigma-70 factor (ECF subfamily)